MSNELIIGLIVAAATGLGSLIVMLWLNISNRIRELKINFATVNTKVSPLWAQVQTKIAEELHHDDPKYTEMDRLLEDLLALKITSDGRVKLKNLLIKRSSDPEVSIEEQKSARMMIAVMEKVLVEAKSITDKLANVAIAFMLGGAQVSVPSLFRFLLK